MDEKPFMNQYKNTLVAALGAAIIVAPSCKRTDPTPSSPSSVVTIDKSAGMGYFTSLRSTPQTFTVTAGVDTKIKGAKGTLIHFYPNSFKDKNGVVVTSGIVNIQLIEMYQPGDMIVNCTSTETSDGVLTSGGELYIHATMGGQELKANKYGLGFKAPAASTKPMEFYTGAANNTDSIITWNVTKVGSSNIDSTGTIYISDSAWTVTSSPYYFFDSCTDFEWVNCDHPYDGTSKYATINAVFPDNTFANTYTTLAVVYPSLNIVIMLGGYQFYSTDHTMKFQGWLPVGPSCKFALMAAKGPNSWQYFEQAGVVSENMSLPVTPTPISLADMKARISVL